MAEFIFSITWGLYGDTVLLIEHAKNLTQLKLQSGTIQSTALVCSACV